MFIDTSALYALVDQGEQHHGQARAWIREHAGAARLVSSNYVVVETAALVERRIGRRAVRGLCQAVLPLIDLAWVARHQHDRALDAHLTASRRSSFVDQVSFVVMRDAGIETAFAFDEDFAAEAFTVVP